jgi:hypothetical protein
VGIFTDRRCIALDMNEETLLKKIGMELGVIFNRDSPMLGLLLEESIGLEPLLLSNLGSGETILLGTVNSEIASRFLLIALYLLSKGKADAPIDVCTEGNWHRPKREDPPYLEKWKFS